MSENSKVLYDFLQDEVHESILKFSKSILKFNPFSTNVPLTDKPGSWFLLAKCLKNTCGRVTF